MKRPAKHMIRLPKDGQLSRRVFLRRAGLAIGLAVAGGGSAWGGARHRDPDAAGSDATDPARAGVPDRPVPSGPFDLHSHPRGVEAARDLGLAGAFFALVADAAIRRPDPQRGSRQVRAFEPGEAWADYGRQIRALHDLLEGSPARLATEVPEADPAAEMRLAAFAAVEGGDMLEGRPERVEQIYRDGVRSVQLVHYTQNELGDLQTEPARFGGLSDAGREVVREMNRLGMVVDVAHASFETTRDVAETSEHPLVLSHSLLKHENVHPALLSRLVTPDHARLVSETGGVIGVWPLGVLSADAVRLDVVSVADWSLQGFVEATLRLIDVVGVDHVGLGSDSLYAQLGRWADGLVGGGLSVEEARKVAGGNAWRVLEEVLRDAAP